MEASLRRPSLRLLGHDLRGDRGAWRHSVAVPGGRHEPRSNASPLYRRCVSDRRRQGATGARVVGAVSRTADGGVSVRAQYRPDGRALAHANEDGQRSDPRTPVAERMAGDEPARRAPPRAQGSGSGRRRLATWARAQRRAACDRNDRARTGVRAVPLRRGEREPGDAQRVRSLLARAELQAVGRTRRTGNSQQPTPNSQKDTGTVGHWKLEVGGWPAMKKLVVVGNGMAGMACLEQILKYSARFDVTVFGDETHVNYNRIMLSSVLAGEKAADDIILNSVEWYERHNIDLRVGVRIVDADVE